MTDREHFPDDKPARPRDESFEALVQVCAVTLPAGRGETNKALADIRSAMSGVDDSELALEIRHRARMYQQAFAGASLTPTALSKHWDRVVVESKTVVAPIALPERSFLRCEICDNQAWVLVMNDVGGAGERAAPCPACERGHKVTQNVYRGSSYWAGKEWKRGEHPQEVELLA